MKKKMNPEKWMKEHKRLLAEYNRCEAASSRAQRALRQLLKKMPETLDGMIPSTTEGR